MSQFSGTESPTSGEESHTKYTYIFFNTGSCATNSCDFVLSLTGSGLVSDFLKETVIPIPCLQKLWHFPRLNKQSSPVASEVVEENFCWRSCLPCHCKLCGNDTAHGREGGYLPPWLSMGTSLIFFWTLFLLLMYHHYRHMLHSQLPLPFSISYKFMPRVQSLGCEPNCAYIE